MKEPKPCPFCDGENVEVDSFTVRWRQAVCNNCGARGPQVHIRTLPDKGMRWENVTDAIRAEWEETARVKALEAWSTHAGDDHE